MTRRVLFALSMAAAIVDVAHHARRSQPPRATQAICGDAGETVVRGNQATNCAIGTMPITAGTGSSRSLTYSFAKSGSETGVYWTHPDTLAIVSHGSRVGTVFRLEAKR